ncbi:hypothetical protein VPHD63_0031 [Vibrio phage D63]
MKDLELRRELIARARVESGDAQRASGRTGRMLLQVILEASKGEVVHVTADTDHYAKSLMENTMQALDSVFGYGCMEVTNHEIQLINGGRIIFTQHRGQGIASGHFHRVQQQSTKSFHDHYSRG